MRPPSFSDVPSRLPVDRLYWYADEVLELTPEERQDFIWIIQGLDNRMIEMESKKKPAK